MKEWFENYVYLTAKTRIMGLIAALLIVTVAVYEIWYIFNALSLAHPDIVDDDLMQVVYRDVSIQALIGLFALLRFVSLLFIKKLKYIWIASAWLGTASMVVLFDLVNRPSCYDASHLICIGSHDTTYGQPLTLVLGAIFVTLGIIKAIFTAVFAAFRYKYK